MNYRRYSICSLLVIPLLGGLLASSGSAADSWIGTRIMPKMNANFKVGDQVVNHSILLPATVRQVRGDWLGVGNGWIENDDVVTLDQAMEYYTKVIQAGSDEDVFLATAHNLRGIAWGDRGELENQLADYREAARLDPSESAHFCNIGNVYSALGDHDSAAKFYTKAIYMSPDDNSVAYVFRAFNWIELGELDKANRDCDQALRIDSKCVGAFACGGMARFKRGEYDRALDNFNNAISVQPESDMGYNSRASFFATCPDPKYRNGRKAVEDATKACELSHWEDAECLDTLASAWAEVGDFEAAVKWQARALELFKGGVRKAEYRQRLALYREGKPYRFGAAKAETAKGEDSLDEIKSPDEVLRGK